MMLVALYAPSHPAAQAGACPARPAPTWGGIAFLPALVSVTSL